MRANIQGLKSFVSLNFGLERNNEEEEGAGGHQGLGPLEDLVGDEREHLCSLSVEQIWHT